MPLFCFFFEGPSNDTMDNIINFAGGSLSSSIAANKIYYAIALVVVILIIWYIYKWATKEEFAETVIPGAFLADPVKTVYSSETYSHGSDPVMDDIEIGLYSGEKMAYTPTSARVPGSTPDNHHSLLSAFK